MWFIAWKVLVWLGTHPVTVNAWRFSMNIIGQITMNKLTLRHHKWIKFWFASRYTWEIYNHRVMLHRILFVPNLVYQLTCSWFRRLLNRILYHIEFHGLSDLRGTLAEKESPRNYFGRCVGLSLYDNSSTIFENISIIRSFE
jgi:hypothetical protein